jgi:carboxymethylenebutenolidase
MKEFMQNGYFILPEAGSGPGVMVLHAWWGLNPFMKSLCDRLAQQGYVVFAPDLYQGKVAQTIDEAKKLRSALKQQQVHQDLLNGLSEFSGLEMVKDKGVGLIGFSLGARFALELSVEEDSPVRAVVTFYGNSQNDYAASKAAYLCHFAESDPYVAQSGIKKLEKNMKAAQRPLTHYVYPDTTHWFFEEDRPDAFHADAAQLAWGRTLEFLHQHLMKQ